MNEEDRLQSRSDPAVRGQTVSMYMLAIRSGMAAGSLVTGVSVHLLGVRMALAINGALAIVIQIALGRIWLRSAPASTIAALGAGRTDHN
jgi:hypothetical protein